MVRPRMVSQLRTGLPLASCAQGAFTSAKGTERCDLRTQTLLRAYRFKCSPFRRWTRHANLTGARLLRSRRKLSVPSGIGRMSVSVATAVFGYTATARPNTAAFLGRFAEPL